MSDPLSSLAILVDAKTKRVSSYAPSGDNLDWVPLEAGETLTLAEIPGAGCIRHIWMTLGADDKLHRRNLVLRAYWDGEDSPSVESPLGDFFGQGWGLNYNFSSLPLAAAPREGKSLVCYFPMPFSDGARITLENQSSERVWRIYYYVDYDETAVRPPNEARFHAWYNQEMTRPEADDLDTENQARVGGPLVNRSDQNNYLLMQTEGAGHFVGVNYYVNSPTPRWYGEGDDMFLVDGEPWPGSAHGTGTEDYFNTAWSPVELYQHPYFGIGKVPADGQAGDAGPYSQRFGWIGKHHVYRFHIQDPIRFRKSLRASIEHGHANALTLELATVAYWYQTEPHTPFPPLAPAAERAPRKAITNIDIHQWRQAWREKMGGGPLWGNERTPENPE